jgi:hypothetical protein
MAGVHVECKSMQELLEAEKAIVTSGPRQGKQGAVRAVVVPGDKRKIKDQNPKESSQAELASDDAALGLFAPSAGFLIGVLFSFHFPHRPSVVLPYSGYDDEFGSVWKLVTAFKPASSTIIDREKFRKQSASQAGIIAAASAEYRSSLVRSINRKEATLRIEEVRELSLLAARGNRIPNTTKITLSRAFRRTNSGNFSINLRYLKQQKNMRRRAS